MDKGDNFSEEDFFKSSNLSLIKEECQPMSKIPGTNNGFEVDADDDLSFVKLLKRELSKKKIQENGTKTEQYKETYLKQIEINNSLNETIQEIKSKIKQYRNQLNVINEKHKTDVKIYTNQIDELRSNILHEKALFDEEQSDIILIRNNNREMQTKIDILEIETQKMIKNRKTNESEINFKENEIALVIKKNNSIKQDIVQVHKDMKKVTDDAQRLNETKERYEEKMESFQKMIEKIQISYDTLLYEIECTQLENKSYQKVLQAHENICLELLKIAAEKLDSHNDEHVLSEITEIMKKLDDNKKKYEKEMKKVNIAKDHNKLYESQLGNSLRIENAGKVEKIEKIMKVDSEEEYGQSEGEFDAAQNYLENLLNSK